MPESQGPIKGFRPLTNAPAANQPSPVTPVPQSSPPVPPRPLTTPQQNPSSQQGSVCQSCKTLNPPGSLYCVNCGTSLPSFGSTSNSLPGVCPQCATPFQPGSQFCIRCGYKLSQPSQPPPSFQSVQRTAPTSIYNQPAAFGMSSITSSPLLWPVVAIVGAGIALISYFLPLIVLRINNPITWLTGGPEQITISVSAWQTMTLSSPTIVGLGGLGEFTSNLYDELNYGQLIMEYADDSTKAMLLLGRLILFVLGAVAVAAVVLAYRSFNEKRDLKKWKMGLGAAGVFILLVTCLAVNVGFNTGSADLDMLLNSVMELSNGFGFWGMLVGFTAFSFASYKKG